MILSDKNIITKRRRKVEVSEKKKGINYTHRKSTLN